MKPFTYHAPTTVDEAVAMLEQYQASCAVVAGGTDVIIELNERHKAPEHVIAIDKLSELRYIKEEGGLVKIGALTSFDDLENDAYVQAHLVAVRRGGKVLRNEVFQLVVNLYCVDRGAFFETFCYAERGISRESAEFEHSAGFCHGCEHFEQTSLHMP